MAYAPSTAIGRCASSAHGQNWESVTADLENADNRETEQNTAQLSRLAPNSLATFQRGCAPPDFGRNGVENEGQRARRGIAKSVG